MIKACFFSLQADILSNSSLGWLDEKDNAHSKKNIQELPAGFMFYSTG
jgi:hypothetical protein